jgi:hypothetical protein
VAEFQLRDIDAAIAIRVKALARERGCSVNDVFLYLIRDGLGLLEEETTDSQLQARIVEEVPNQLADDEAAVLQAAMEALEQLPADRSPFRLAGRDAK